MGRAYGIIVLVVHARKSSTVKEFVGSSAKDSGIDPWSDWYFGAIGILDRCVLMSITRAVIVALRIQQFQKTCIL